MKKIQIILLLSPIFFALNLYASKSPTINPQAHLQKHNIHSAKQSMLMRTHLSKLIQPVPSSQTAFSPEPTLPTSITRNLTPPNTRHTIPQTSTNSSLNSSAPSSTKTSLLQQITQKQPKTTPNNRQPIKLKSPIANAAKTARKRAERKNTKNKTVSQLSKGINQPSDESVLSTSKQARTYTIIDPKKVIRDPQKMESELQDYIKPFHQEYPNIPDTVLATLGFEFIEISSQASISNISINNIPGINIYRNIPIINKLIPEPQREAKIGDYIGYNTASTKTITNPKESQLIDINVKNLYQALPLINKVYSVFYQHNELPAVEQYMTDTMDNYIQEFRTTGEQYQHTPDTLISAYIIERFKEKKQKMSPTQLVENEANFDIQKPTPAQQLYAAIKSIELINKKAIKQNPNIASKGTLDFSTLPLQDKLTKVIQEGGSSTRLLQISDFDPQTILPQEDINLASKQIATKLNKQYTSHQAFLTNPDNQTAFEQLEIEFTQLAEDIATTAQQYNININALNLQAIRNLATVQNRIEHLLITALNFKDNMNNAIIQQKIIDFMADMGPSQGISIKELLQQNSKQKNLLPKAQKWKGFIRIPGDNPITKQNRELSTALTELLDTIQTEAQSIESDFQHTDFIPQTQGLSKEQIKAEIKNYVAQKITKSANLLKIEQFNIDITSYIEDQIYLDFIQLQKKYADLQMKAQLKLQTYLQYKKHAITQILLDCFKELQRHNTKQDIITQIKELFEQYNAQPFEDQDIHPLIQILKKLRSDTETTAGIIALYTEVFQQLDKKLAPSQFIIKQYKNAIEQFIESNTQKPITQTLVDEIKNKITDLRNLTEINQDEINQFKEKLVNPLSRPFNPNLEDLINIYQEILEQLQEKLELQGKPATEKVTQAIQQIPQAKNIQEAMRNIGKALYYTPHATNELVDPIKGYVVAVLGALGISFAALPPAIQHMIIEYIRGTSASMVAIQNNSSLDDNEKKTLQQQALQAMMSDIANLVIANTINADTDIVATKNLETITLNAGFNTMIKSLAPDNQNFYHYQPSKTNNAIPVNMNKFQQQYNDMLINKAVGPQKLPYHSLTTQYDPTIPSYESLLHMDIGS